MRPVEQFLYENRLRGRAVRLMAESDSWIVALSFPLIIYPLVQWLSNWNDILEEFTLGGVKACAEW